MSGSTVSSNAISTSPLEEWMQRHSSLMHDALLWNQYLNNKTNVRSLHQENDGGIDAGAPSISKTSPTVIDWDFFLDEIWEACSKEEQQDFLQQHSDLLHWLCLHGAPLEVLEEIIAASGTKSTTAVTDLLLLQSEYTTNYYNATPLHLACFFGSASTVSFLLSCVEKEASDDLARSQIMKQLLHAPDQEGRLLIHVALRRSQQKQQDENDDLSIVKLLLEYEDTTVLTTTEQQIQAQTLYVPDKSNLIALSMAYTASEPVLLYVLDHVAKHTPRGSLQQKIVPQQHPLKRPALHDVLRNCPSSPAAAVRKLATGKSTRNLFQTDRRGQLPLHVALSGTTKSVSASVLAELINNDVEGTSFTMKDKKQRTPIDLLLYRIFRARDSNIIPCLQELAKADTARRFFASGAEEQQPSFLDRLVQEIIIEERNKDASGKQERTTRYNVNMLSKQAAIIVYSCTPPGIGTSYNSSTATLRQRILGESAFHNLIYSNPDFHRTLNQQMTQRSFTFFFMVDLYVRISLVATYTSVSNRSIRGDSGNTDPLLFAITYVLAMYLLLWQVKTIYLHQLYYLRELWNMMDLVTTICVIVSSMCFQANLSHDGSFRSFNVWVGGMAWFVIVAGALRSTFLPFSVFVSGLMLTLVYMIPYGITTLLMLGAFGDMYFKSVYGTPSCSVPDYEDFCVYNQSILKSYTMFVGGIDISMLAPDADRNLLWLTIFYGFFFPIIMLTILVAVIFDAWGKVSPSGRLYFWKYRHEFLTETSETPRWYCSGCWDWSFLHSWEKRMALLIHRFESTPLALSQSTEFSEQWKLVLGYCLDATTLLFCFVGGLCTASLMWPYGFRKFIFAPVVVEEASPSELLTTVSVDGPTTHVDSMGSMHDDDSWKEGSIHSRTKSYK